MAGASFVNGRGVVSISRGPTPAQSAAARSGPWRRRRGGDRAPPQVAPPLLPSLRQRGPRVEGVCQDGERPARGKFGLWMHLPGVRIN